MESEESVLMMSFNFSVMNPHSNLDIVCAVDSVLKLPQTLGMELRWRIRSMLEKSVFYSQFDKKVVESCAIIEVEQGYQDPAG
jgi:hypothetical protein